MAVEGNNLGLLVTVQTLGGSQMDEKVVRFSSGRNHHKSKQPMLVLFTDDGRRAAALDNTVKGSLTHNRVIINVLLLYFFLF